MSDCTEPTFVPYFGYPDPSAAIDWLGEAFGLEAAQVVQNDDGRVVHAELHFDGGMMMLGPEGEDAMESVAGERRVGPGVYVVVDDPDAHYERAESGGAEIVFPPEDTEFGSRQYRARDLAGYEWTFGTYKPTAAVE